ncbi:MAG: FAD-dependent oxidoreductase, partial [Deltaproteobacteria bacterium]|nr:FAD-dependent oxidoreductase [Deltaproteobacteria bacterium]
SPGGGGGRLRGDLGSVPGEPCRVGALQRLVQGRLRRAHVALSAWLHEESAEEWLAVPDAELLRRVAGELVRLFPRYAGHLEPLLVQRWPEALPVYGAGQVAQVSAFSERGQGHGGIWLCGDYLNHPWVEGTVRCGEKVAARVGR